METPGISAPVGSETVPTIRPVAVCDHRAETPNRQRTKTLTLRCNIGFLRSDDWHYASTRGERTSIRRERTSTRDDHMDFACMLTPKCRLEKAIYRQYQGGCKLRLPWTQFETRLQGK